MELFDEDEAQQVVMRLASLTQKGRLDWATYGTGDAANFQFKTQIGDIIYTIRSRDKDDYAPHLLGIWDGNQDGAAAKLQEIDSTYESTEMGSVLSDLYTDVKRRVLNLDALASNILSQLDELDRSE